ncbi:hypothetical protein KC19_6G199500, partial [Ceratodon purpureus]
IIESHQDSNTLLQQLPAATLRGEQIASTQASNTRRATHHGSLALESALGTVLCRHLSVTGGTKAKTSEASRR